MLRIDIAQIANPPPPPSLLKCSYVIKPLSLFISPGPHFVYCIIRTSALVSMTTFTMVPHFPLAPSTFAPPSTRVLWTLLNLFLLHLVHFFFLLWFCLVLFLLFIFFCLVELVFFDSFENPGYHFHCLFQHWFLQNSHLDVTCMCLCTNIDSHRIHSFLHCVSHNI